MERYVSRRRTVRVAGLDEVGRGSWAGPVSVGGAVYDPGRPWPDGLRDSKRLREPAREAMYPQVDAWCAEWAVGHAGPAECDALGMTAALRLAAQRAIASLSAPPDVVLVDGPFDYLTTPLPADGESGDGSGDDAGPEVRTVVRGDDRCVAIAAASVLAKVTRDRMMRALAPEFPGFDFDRNKGYPSPVHRRALGDTGLTAIHRRSWSFADGLTTV